MIKKKFQQGTIKRHADGFGFFIPDHPDQPDVYIPKHSMTGIMTNDRVMVEVVPEKGGDRFRGEIMRVISRGTSKVVGSFFPINDKYGLIKDEGKGWGQDLKIKIEDSMGAQKGQMVSAQIISFPEDKSEFLGRVIEIIGHSLDPLTDVKRVLINNNIPHEFPTPVLTEANRFSEHVTEQDMKGRKDLRNLNFITIDGATARDFDDAIYISSSDHGFRLYVAIADVSHYVQVGTAIDKEAYERGTSVYFPNFVVPMLPEVLSNGLCSLNPMVPRLALVAEMLFDFTGTMSESSFYEAVIESKSRVTYGEAQEVIDGVDAVKHKHVVEEILRASDLAKILMTKRFREGSLDLEIPEVQMVIDGSGNPIDLIRSERLFAHRVIEEMMLAANVAVAKFLSDKEIPALYRIHEEPNQEMIQILEKYLSTFGGRINIQGGKLQKKLTKALQEFEGKPESQVLNILTLRSMSQAKYSSGNVGHFGLGFDFYTHFTSPIRRYPDLIVHRLVKNLVVPNSKYRLMQEQDLVTAGTMLSACEQRSVKAERQFQSIKKARFMEKHIGEEFDGIVSSVAKFGIFVLLRMFEVDGLVHIENLGNDRFEFDEENLWLVAKRSGFKYAIGDLVRIRVVNVDIDAGQIDFELASTAKNSENNSRKNTFEKKYVRPKSKEPQDKKNQKSRGEKTNNKNPKSKEQRNDNSKSKSFKKVDFKKFRKKSNKKKRG